MGKEPNILKKSSGERLFKETAGVSRFERTVWGRVEELILDYFLVLAKQAGERAQAEGRTVLDDSDIVAPEGSGTSTSSPEELIGFLKAMPTEEIVTFTRLMESWFKAEKEAA